MNQFNSKEEAEQACDKQLIPHFAIISGYQQLQSGPMPIWSILPGDQPSAKEKFAAAIDSLNLPAQHRALLLSAIMDYFFELLREVRVQDAKLFKGKGETR